MVLKKTLTEAGGVGKRWKGGWREEGREREREGGKKERKRN